MRQILTACWCLLSLGATAQPGIDEMRQAQRQLTSSFFSAIDCGLVLFAIFGTCGALRIYYNIQMGHPRMDQAVANWFFAALFAVLAGVFLQAVFGI